MQLMSFDIEIADIFELQPGEDLDAYAPFHVAVASTAVHNGGEERIWHSTDDSGKPARQMHPETARELLLYLQVMQHDGTMVCAWNGLGFDLRWLGYMANDMELAAAVALKSYDPMFQFFTRRGFPISLARVGQAMKLTQEKTMSGADAPRQWQAGHYEAVMQYVLGDSQMTNQIVAEILRRGEVCWVTQKGFFRREPMPELLPVEQVLLEPEPDQSWMDRPMATRRKFYQWLPPEYHPPQT